MVSAYDVARDILASVVGLHHSQDSFARAGAYTSYVGAKGVTSWADGRSGGKPPHSQSLVSHNIPHPLVFVSVASKGLKVLRKWFRINTYADFYKCCF